MGDAGEGLIDADARLQERIDELEQERTAARGRRRPEDPEKVRQRESLKLARAELQQQLARTEHPARKQQIAQAVAEIEKRLSELDAAAPGPASSRRP
jgi:membrane protein involved in colicin uptake